MIIPTGVKSRLEAIFGPDKITFQQVGQLDEKDYVKVRLVGSQHDLVSAVTQLFQEGQIHVVIGTKSLLGEGWDAPCVNSLILASFVGSFMLSNQMRGRAIRIWPENRRRQVAFGIWCRLILRRKTLQEERRRRGFTDWNR